MRTESDIRSREKIYTDEATASVDYKASPHEVLEAIDRLLAQEQMEIVMLDMGDDSYVFTLGMRELPSKEDAEAVLRSAAENFVDRMGG